MITPDKSREAEESAAALSDSIEKSLKHGRYDLSLLAAAQRLNTLVDRAKAPQTKADLEYLKMKCMISEVFDYFGRFNEARKVLSDGPQVLDKLRRRKKAAAPVSSEETRKLAREEVRFCLEYAQIFYRSHNYQIAKDIVIDCQDVVTKHIADDADFPCFGTRARTMYYLGRVYRQVNDYERSESCFIEAINYHHLRAMKKLEGNGGKIKEKIREELDFARHKSALCLALGLGWLSYTRGALVKAKSYIMPARVLLLSTSDIINSAYLQLIQGAIERSLAGRDPEKIGIATELLQKSCLTFEKAKHSAYLARAAFELSLAYLYAGDTKAADRERIKVQEISEERNDVRWCCNSWILESRIRRAEGEVEEAQRLASKACTLAGKRKQFLCKIDALIARGEAKALRNQFVGARADFQEALKINAGRYPDAQGRTAETTNQKIEAVCRLNIARTYILKDDSRQAQPHLERWNELREQVEHLSVRDFGDEVQKAFSKLRTPFVIPAAPASLNYKKHRDALFEWLRREAQHQSSQKGAQDRLLGISREARRKRAKKRSSKKG